MGGCLNVLESFLSLVIVLQCFVMILEMLSSFGLNVTVNIIQVMA